MASGINARHLLELVIRPTLKAMGETYYSRSAERLVLGTAAVESGLVDLKQHRGPALGLWQMEPATFDSLWSDLIAKRTDLRMRMLCFSSRCSEIPPADELVWNLRLGAAMCRCRYLWDPQILPQPDDVQGMAETWKRAYNSAAGAGTPEQFIRAWQRIVSPILT